VPFPEDLALFLVKLGYVTPEQSLALGYDTTKILNDRSTARETETASYEQRMLQAWFLLTRAGECVQAQRPSSPAEAISADRANGLEDIVKVLQSNNAGKPTAVRVDSPQAGDLVSTLTFYRGASGLRNSSATAAERTRESEMTPCL